MGFGKSVLLYLATFGVFFVIDLVWLMLMNSRFYKKALSGLMAEKVKWLPAILFYLLFVFAVQVLIVMPAVGNDTWFTVLWRGGLMGMVCYGTYNFTNLASIRDWPLKVSVVDIIWGTCLTAAVATVGFFIASAIA